VRQDHGEHPPVAGQDVHRHRGQAAGLGAGDQRAHQRRAHSPALPGVGHHHADVGSPGARQAKGTGPVRGHRMPDDEAAADRDHGFDALGVTGQAAEQRRARCDRAEEAQVAALLREPGEELAEGGRIRSPRGPDNGGGTVGAGRHRRGRDDGSGVIGAGRRRLGLDDWLGNGDRATGAPVLGSGHGLSIVPDC
jgi:hypothetical protein